MKIYFAGPLFTEYERSYISQCAVKLRNHGIDPFVPHESFVPPIPGDERSKAIRCLDNDFSGISNSEALLAILNGPEIDDGTACEIGIFYSLMQSDPSKKGIIGLVNDWRTKDGGEGKGLNGFVVGCIKQVGVICSTLDEAIEVLDSWKDKDPE